MKETKEVKIDLHDKIIDEIEKETLLNVRGALKSLIDVMQNAISKGRESALVITKLEEASMWLGLDMTKKGIFKPYTDEQNKINLPAGT